MSLDDALDLAHFKTLLEQRAAELDRLLGDAESRSQSVELDQSKVGRLSRMDALQQQAMNDAIRSRARHERVRLNWPSSAGTRATMAGVTNAAS